MYQLLFTERFKRNFKKVISNDEPLANKVEEILKMIAQEPFQQRLRSHKVAAKDIGSAWSTRVTGDIRIIWLYSKEYKNTLEIVNIGTHTGQHRVYK